MLLIDEAKKARKNSYSPYSDFKVGAAILLKNGDIIKGCNIENAAYGDSMCAERVALYNAYSSGIKKSDIVSMAIVGDTKKPIRPCGSCLQVMNELMNKKTKIIMANISGDVEEHYIDELLPYGFEVLL